MRQFVALAWFAVCGLMMHSATGLYIPDYFDDATAALSEDDILLKKYIGLLPLDKDDVTPVSTQTVRAALLDAQTQHDILKKSKAPNGELSLLKRVLIQAFQELIQELSNALGITHDGELGRKRN